MARDAIINVTIPPAVREAFKALNLPNWRQIERAATPQMAQALLMYMRNVATQAFADSGLVSRTGTMAHELPDSARVFGTDRFDHIKGYYLVDDYIAAHEGVTAEGGFTEIRPKKAQKLAIPIADGLRPDGSPKRRSPSAWRQFGTFILRGKNGKTYIAYKSGSKGDETLKLLYILVDEVKLPARLGLRRHFEDDLALLVAAWGEIMVSEMLAQNFFELSRGVRPSMNMTFIAPVISR